jgi:quaternary ammonium compound-resistance protein SugE
MAAMPADAFSHDWISSNRSGVFRGTAPAHHASNVTGRPALQELSMSWVFLFIAGVFEIGWAVGLKYTEGFSKPLPTVLTIGAMAISLWMLGLALKELPIGTAYAIWTGIGTVGTAILGIYLFNDPATVVRLACIGLIVAGIVGLKLVA